MVLGSNPSAPIYPSMNHTIPHSVPVKILAAGLGIAAAIRLVAGFGIAAYPLNLIACLILGGAILSGGIVQWLLRKRSGQPDAGGFFVDIRRGIRRDDD